MAYDPTTETRELWKVIMQDNWDSTHHPVWDNETLENKYIRTDYNALVAKMPIKTYSNEEFRSHEGLCIGVIRTFTPLAGMDVDELLEFGPPRFNKFLPCDGRRLRIIDHHLLQTIIRDLFGECSDDTFSLPDFRPVGIDPTDEERKRLIRLPYAGPGLIPMISTAGNFPTL